MNAHWIDPVDERFNDLRCRYRSAGGLARDSEIAPRVGNRHPLGITSLLRRVARRELVFFYWHDTLWFPIFQFNWADMSIRPDVARVTAELTDWTDDWERTDWFVHPHCALEHRTPLSLLDSQPQRLVELARMQHFLCKG